MNGEGALYAMAAAFLLIGVSMLLTLPWRQVRNPMESLSPQRIAFESSLGRRVWAGVLNAIAAAFFPPLVYMCVVMFSGDMTGDLIVIPWFAVQALAMSSWFVLPTGGILGAFMPRWIGLLCGRAAMVRGMQIGFWVGVVAALGVQLTLLLWIPPSEGRWSDISRIMFQPFLLLVTVLSPWSAVWVGLCAWRWSEAPRTDTPTDVPVAE